MRDTVILMSNSTELPQTPSAPPSRYPLSAVSPEQVFHDFAPRIYSLALRMLGNEPDAEDVTQDVLVQVVRHLDSFRGDSQLSTWLHRVTVNAALAARRRQARRQECQVESSVEVLADPARPAVVAPDGLALQVELREQLERAIALLPTMYRDVFVLADVESLPNAEIGELLGLSLAAVKSRLHRARMMVRDALRPYVEADNEGR